MSGHQGFINDDMKEKVGKIVDNLKKNWDDAKKKNKDDPNTEQAAKAYFAAKAIADALVVGTTPVEDFSKAAKALPALIKKSQDAAAAVKDGEDDTKAEAEPEGKVVFANTTVKNACNDQKTKTKIASILAAGSTYKGTSTPYLRAWHDHVDNRTAVGFKWEGKNLKIVAFGTKPASSSINGDGGYTWVQQ